MEVKLVFDSNKLLLDNKLHVSRFDDDSTEPYSFSRIECYKCNNLTCFGTFMSVNETIYGYECLECDVFYCICGDCYDEKFGDITTNDKNHKINLLELKYHYIDDDIKIKNDKKYKISKPNISDHFCDPVRKVTYITPTYCYNQTKFGYITGPDGGYPSYWKCKCNEELFELLDK